MLKRNLHKALALLASVVILCTVLPLSALFSAGADGDSIIVNGDFENGKANWAFNSGTAEVVSDAHGGSSAIKLTNPGRWAEGAIQTVPAEANAEYKITWYSKRVSGSGAFNLYVMNANGYANLQSAGGQNWMNETSGNWVKNEYIVKTGDATSVMLKFSTEASNPGSILLDDITMVKVGGGSVTPDEPVEPSANMLTNGDFETGDTTGWDNLWGSNTVSIVAGRNGGSAMSVISGEWKHVRQKIAVEADTDYVITGWCKDITDMTLLIKDGADSQNLKQAGMNAGSAWTQITLEINSGAYTELIVSLMGTSANAKGTFDDFVMVKKGTVIPDEPAVGNMLLNGDFETGDASNWENVWDNNTVSIVAGRNGGSALSVVSGEWKIVRQLVTVEPNTDYVVSGWCKDITDMTLLIKDGNDTVNMEQAGMSGSTEWKETVLEFNSGENTAVYVCLMGTSANAKGTFDDFVMTKKGDEPVDPPVDPNAGKIVNGDFETGDLSGWEKWQSTDISADAKYEGAYGVNIKGNGGWGGMLNQTIALTKGKSYKLAFWYKANANGFNWKLEKGDGTNYVAGWCNSTTWTLVEAEFTAETDSAVLNFCGAGNNIAEDVYIDNVSLTELTQASDDGYLLNGDFETGAASPWTTYGHTTIAADAAYEGNYGLHMIGDGGWGGLAFQDFTVEVGETYVVKMMMKTVANGVNIQIQNPDGVNVGGGWFNATTWTELTYEFTATADKARINICGSGSGAPESVYLDNVSVSVKGALPTGIVNGDFEQGEEGWALNSSFATIVDEFHGGAHALQLTNPSAWSEAALQSVAVEPNTNYVITWYSKRVEGNAAFMFTVMDSANVNLTVVSGQSWMNETSGNWVENTMVVTTGADGIIKIKLTAEAADAGIILIDDITVEKQGDEPDEPDEPIDPTANLVKNGDFSNGTEGWTWSETAKVDEDNGYISGKPSAWLEHNKAYGEGLTQMIKMEKNTDYVIIFYTKRVSGNGSWDLFLMDGDTINNGNVNIETTSGNRWFNQSADAGWVKTKLEFNSGEMTKAFFKFGPEDDNSGIFLLDDVSMHKKGYEPSEPDVPVIPESGMEMTSYGVLNNRPISADKNILQNGNFEATGGQWDVADFHNEYVSVVADDTTRFGSNSLFFNTSALTEADAVKNIFWLELEPNTSYVFSTWIKGALLADDNRGRATVGVVNENGQFLADREILFLDGTRQLVPTSWDDQWHLRSVEFITGSESATVGIALAGWGSKMWIDDMALFKVGDGTKYVSENMGGGVNLSFDFDKIACKEENSLIPDPNMNKADEAKFWSTSYGWRNGFVSFVDNEYEYGASMKYTSTGDNAATYIIKWVDVEPNTQYTFAVDIKILEDGFGRLGLLDNKKRDKVEFFSVSFDSYDYDDSENTGWRTVVTSFNTDVYDRIGIAFVDDGGEVLLDNMRLFKNTDGADVVDAYIAPPVEDDPFTGVDDPVEGEDPVEEEDPQEEDEETTKKKKKKKKVTPAPAFDPMVWVWVGVGSAVALAGAAVTIILLVKKRKKAAAAAAATATADNAGDPPAPTPAE